MSKAWSYIEDVEEARALVAQGLISKAWPEGPLKQTREVMNSEVIHAYRTTA